MAKYFQSRKYTNSMDEPPCLSSFTIPEAEELQCSVCLDVFTDPVSTPCGHNFCKSCLNQCWENSQDYKCPFCRNPFHKRPELKVNLALRQLVQPFKERFRIKRFEVLCDICYDVKMKALKSCLLCQTSYCKTHLEPHQRVLNLKKHKLMEPVRNIKDYICQKHERPLELFCRDDGMYICVFCTDGDHKTHNTVSLEEESKVKKSQLMKTQKEIQDMIQGKIKKIRYIKCSAEPRKKSTEQEKAASVELLSSLIHSIERFQAELLETMETKQKEAEKMDEELIQELEQEVSKLKMRNTELDHLSHTEDHLHLLQIHPFLCTTAHSRNWSEISMNTDVNEDTLRKALTQLQETLDQKISHTMFKKMQDYAVDVTLDPDTANPYLILSYDGKQVRSGVIKQTLPNNPERFDICACVLGKEGFLSRRFYFEVQVKGKIKWDLGVARESINRKGKISVSPQDGFWTVALRNKTHYWACADPPVHLSLRVKPQTVGVFVDYEEGLVSFYDIESKTQIYSFTAQTFTNRLHPYFCPFPNDDGKNSAPLIILPVSQYTNF